MSKTPLLVHLIFHPASDNAHNLALTIHKALNADPALPGLRLSTVFCPTDGVLPPADYPLDEAERNFVVVLADYWVVDGNSGQLRTWSGFIGDLWAACDTSPNRFFPVQLDETAWGFDPRLAGTTFLRGFAERDPAARATLVIRRLVIELCRYLADEPQGTDEHSKAPVKLFLSHAKVDLDSEPKVFHALEDYLRQDQPVRAWIDSGNIEAGSAFGERITTGIQDSSVLCVLTDNYSTREWCRKEVLLAKEHRRPLVVIAAFNSQEVRSFPYLGNVPVFRWPCPAADAGQTAALHRNAAMAAVDLMLKETLRHLHTRLLLEDDKQDGDILLSRPPELLSVLQAREAGAILYPDPPLGLEELNLLGNAVPVPLTTPLARLASQRPLQGTRIGLTMSESTDIHRFGLDPLHLGDAMIEISRYLLIKGATLVYGGDLQPADAHRNRLPP
jgi:hypothetical protein